MTRMLNAYAGLGGNRKLLTNVEVVAVEKDPKIAAVYQKLYPEDRVIVGDAHKYIEENFRDFDFIWSSPPCQSHSKMMKATRHDVARYPDMNLYQEILLLKHFFEGDWVVENVAPYYEPLIEAQKVGRHLFWSNYFFLANDVPRPSGFIDNASVEALKEWLGIEFEERIYYDGNHCPAQVLRNCVHPNLGLQIYSQSETGR